MMNGVELVIQRSNASGGAHCSSFVGLGLSSPVLIVLADYGTAASRKSQLELSHSLEAEITGSFGGQQVSAPCGGAIADLGNCHARGDAACQKVLVLIGDELSPPSTGAIDLSDEWAAGGGDYAILPVFPSSARASVFGLLPSSAAAANAIFWTQHPNEVLSALFAIANLTASQSRLFISYRQVDSAALAIQLFDALSHEGFDVFLDHFRIPPGVNFQSRLTQELGDKSMMLLLESERLAESEWVAHEISVAKECGLGLLGILLPRGRPQPSLDKGNRLAVLDDNDFEGDTFSNDAKLKEGSLAGLVTSIQSQHDRTLVARRKILEQSFEGALTREGCAFQRIQNGAFSVTAAGKDYLAWLTPRPPEMVDFHRAHGSVAGATGVIIGLSRLMEPARASQTTWLAELCQLYFADEGQLSQVARDIAGGYL